MEYQNALNWAQVQDRNDPLSTFRNSFFIPQHEGKDAVYFTGNSLGLQPKGAKAALEQELDDWAKYGVEGHFDAVNPWFAYHERFAPLLAPLVGAKEHEVVAMNGLTTNLHLMMVSFYKPFGKRYKILCEAKAFPSDQYALESQVRFHGYDPEDAIIEVGPRDGEHTIRPEDFEKVIGEQGDEIALMMIGGVNYYTGQVMPMKRLTQAAKEKGVAVGWDLAHGVGNIPLELHDWDVDFAAWCSYKYLNSGPGSVSGVFIHERHATNKSLKRFAGWWGQDKGSRFLMEKGFHPIPTAEGWQLSNAPVLAMAVHAVALELFKEAGFTNLQEKSKKLTGYLEYVLGELTKESAGTSFEVITPSNSEDRGCQLSILCHGQGKDLFNKITERGVIADWREPNVIRVAPVPLYNSFEDVFRFGKIIKDSI